MKPSLPIAFTLIALAGAGAAFAATGGNTDAANPPASMEKHEWKEHEGFAPHGGEQSGPQEH